jgi:hypothetical protein
VRPGVSFEQHQSGGSCRLRRDWMRARWRRIAREQAVHTGRERAFRRADGEVVVIAHEAVAMQDPSRAADFFRQQLREETAIVAIAEIGLPSLPRDMTW